MADKKVMLTEDGYNKLVEKVNYLKSVRRIEIAERLKAAIALGDLSENSEYDDAKNEQAFLEGEIQELEAKIRNSDIIKAGSGDVVQMGSKVVVLDVEFAEDGPQTFEDMMARFKKTSDEVQSDLKRATGDPRRGGRRKK